MAFWGTELKPGRPFTLTPNDKGRLHLSQATIAKCSAEQRTVVQCNVGKCGPVLLCSLYPGKCESFQLNLEFEEKEEVIFSVLGPCTVHLTGYYCSRGRLYDGGDDSESYGEDVGQSESDKSSDDDDYEDSFIDDEEYPSVQLDESDIQASSDELVKDASNVKAKNNRKEKCRRRIKKFQVSDSEEGSNWKLGVFANDDVNDTKSEDKLPISTSKSTKNESAKKVVSRDVTESEDDFIVEAQSNGNAKFEAVSLVSPDLNHEEVATPKNKNKKKKKKEVSKDTEGLEDGTVGKKKHKEAEEKASLIEDSIKTTQDSNNLNSEDLPKSKKRRRRTKQKSPQVVVDKKITPDSNNLNSEDLPKSKKRRRRRTKQESPQAVVDKNVANITSSGEKKEKRACEI